MLFPVPLTLVHAHSRGLNHSGVFWPALRRFIMARRCRLVFLAPPARELFRFPADCRVDPSLLFRRARAA